MCKIRQRRKRRCFKKIISKTDNMFMIRNEVKEERKQTDKKTDRQADRDRIIIYRQTDKQAHRDRIEICKQTNVIDRKASKAR